MRIVRMVRLGEMMIFHEEKDGESEWYAIISTADLTPPPALCPHINGSAVLKSDNKLSRKTKCQRYNLLLYHLESGDNSAQSCWFSAC